MNITQQSGPTFTVTQAAPLFDLIEHYELTMSPGSLLDTLSAYAGHIEDATERAVRAARAQGSSWEHIGACLGITKQGAQQRFGR